MHGKQAVIRYHQKSFAFVYDEDSFEEAKAHAAIDGLTEWSPHQVPDAEVQLNYMQQQMGLHEQRKHAERA